MANIVLKQNAVIQHDLVNVGRMVDERLSDLNLENLAATDQTIKALKTLRAELNKEFKEFEEQRKTIKEIVAKPYKDLEDVYDIQVSGKYKSAIGILKDKIDEYEIKVKQDKQEVVENYFNEVRDFSGLDFLKFSDLRININLSTSIQRYREDIDEFVSRIGDDINLIKTQEYKAEILVEYKKDLNCSRAIQDVTERKAAEKIEQERRQQAEKERKHKSLLSLGFEYADFEKAYVHNTHKEFYMSLEDVKTRSSIEFDAMLVDFAKRIKAKAEVTAPVKIDAPIEQAPEPEPIAQEVLTARFEVSGTLEQLQELNRYLKDNKLTYKNID